MKQVLLSTILLVPLLLAGCVSAGVTVGAYPDDSEYTYPSYYYDNPYIGPAVGVYYYNDGPYYGHHYHHYSNGFSRVGSSTTVHSGNHFSGTRTASVSSHGHTSGGSHTSSAHVSAITSH